VAINPRFGPPKHYILPGLRQNPATDTTRTILAKVAESLRQLKSDNLAADLEFVVEALEKNEDALAVLLRLVVKGKQVQDGYRLSTAAATDERKSAKQKIDAVIRECLGNKKYLSDSAAFRDNEKAINNELKARGLRPIKERAFRSRLAKPRK
jgi:hypothetical protein